MNWFDNEKSAQLVAYVESNRLRQIKMRHLSAFVETVRCESLKAASERVFLTQSAISKTLKDLERP